MIIEMPDTYYLNVNNTVTCPADPRKRYGWTAQTPLKISWDTVTNKLIIEEKVIVAESDK